MLKKSMLLLSAILFASLIIFTGCESDNATEPAAVSVDPNYSVDNIKKVSVNMDRSGFTVYIPNGDFSRPLLPNNSYAGALYSWSASSQDCAVTRDYAPGNQIICLRGSTGGGDGSSDALISNWIQVNPGKTYMVSGGVYRSNAQDNVYIDFNDGIGVGPNFTDSHASATSVGVWELQTATVTIPQYTLFIKIRCVRDGANVGNALFRSLSIYEL
ncbi:MAG: hypothetical protein ACEPO8_12700 [Rhodothermaceae bacterium]